MPSSPRASVSSPLSPNFAMTPIIAPSPPALKGRHRGHSISIAALARRASDLVAPPLSRVASSCSRALHPNAENLNLNVEAEEFPTSFRSRGPATVPDSSALSTWWSGNELIPRPWTDPPKRKKTVPSEQTEGWIQTRERVAKAAASVLGLAADVGHETLMLSVNALGFVPVAGLEQAAKTLLDIWDALQMVDMNRLSCLRLTERCAETLISVHQDISQEGLASAEELKAPVAQLCYSFLQVHEFLQKQIHRPFIKRYLKCKEILKQIAACDTSLNDSMTVFNLSVQIRILKRIHNNEVRHHATSQNLIRSGILAASSEAPPIPSALTKPISTLSVDEVQHAILSLVARQNERDTSHDMVDLTELMKSALATNSDYEMIRILQVGREEMPEAIKTLQRAVELMVESSDDHAVGCDEASTTSSGSTTTNSSSNTSQVNSEYLTSDARSSQTSLTCSLPGEIRSTLDREFVETAIDALKRMSHGVEHSLPSWTITRYEVDREKVIGYGFFSDVYKGKWRGQTVAIKSLASTTPRHLYLKEAEIWKTLKHENVLELYGASSAIGEPPWFFVSPYLRNGSLVEYLKGTAHNTNANSDADPDLVKMMLEVAQGMEYLHGQGVLHGDLKAVNVLVDDDIRCVISDFGQSEMKSEAYRLSGTPPPVGKRGTLRWQAPELMSGRNDLTMEMDIYAYAISCVEILTMGELPWGRIDDAVLIRFVLDEDKRPAIPRKHKIPIAVDDLIQSCWRREPLVRPHFSRVVRLLKKIIVGGGDDILASPSVMMAERGSSAIFIGKEFQETAVAATGGSSAAAAPDLHLPTTVLYTPSPNHSCASIAPNQASVESLGMNLNEGYESLPPNNGDVTSDMRNERLYRILLSHNFHPSLTLPLWTPSLIPLGSVGYLSKPSGSFIQLFNALEAHSTLGLKGMPSLSGYGRVMTGNVRQDNRNVALRGFDAGRAAMSGFLTFTGKAGAPLSQSISRRASSPLRASRKTAYLYSETTVYSYMQDLEAPKDWFKANIATILKIFGNEHRIQKEDLFLIIGTLNTPDYALFVSHDHPDGQLHFNVFSAPKVGQPWGMFTTDTTPSSGPSYREPVPGQSISANKVSNHGAGHNTILMARLRFKPDVLEPTSL